MNLPALIIPLQYLSAEVYCSQYSPDLQNMLCVHGELAWA